MGAVGSDRAHRDASRLTPRFVSPHLLRRSFARLSLGRNLEKIRQMVDESRDYLFAKTNWPLGKIDFSDSPRGPTFFRSSLELP